MSVELDPFSPEMPAPQASTHLQEEVTTPKPSGMKDDQPEPKPSKPMSVDDAVRKAAEDVEKGKDKPEPDPKPKAKPEAKVAEEKPQQERGDGGRFKPREETQELPKAQAEGDGEGEQGGETNRPSEGREDKPPARFLPRAKEKWNSVDPDVRGEIKRMESEFEEGRASFEEDRAFRKELRQFEDMAKQAGTNVRAALENYTSIDKLLRENASAGIERILASINVTPQQYAQYVMGQSNQPQPTQADRQTAALQQQVQQLTQQIEQLTAGTQQDRESARLAELERSVIAPFKADHPRYQELEPDIVFFLNSGKIPSNMSERQRLEHAYDMAERINPASSSYTPERLKPAPDDRPLNPAGRKSVRGAPSAGTSMKPNSAIVSIEDAVKAAMAER